jgi:ABC-type nitrate/sulfonate/bicarbonate transport system ATPase subunit
MAGLTSSAGPLEPREPALAGGINVQINRKSFEEHGHERVLMKDFYLSVPPGSFTTLMGPSGSGKTTLLHMIAGLDTHYDGVISVGAKPMKGPGRDVQIVFQDYRLLPWKTVLNNIRFAQPKMRSSPTAGNSSQPNAIQPISDLISTFGLSGLERRWPRALSGGEMCRVALARAFVFPPKVLLLDEPFRNLDVFTKLNLQEYLTKALAKFRTTVLMVSHSIEDAAFLSDRVCVLSPSPLQVYKIVDIGIPRPRKRDYPDLIKISSEILQMCTEVGVPAGAGSREGAKAAGAGPC